MLGQDHVEEDKILYRQLRSVKAGEVQRFYIHYTPDASKNGDHDVARCVPNLWVKIKNRELIALRAAYLAGPYVLYVDCRTEDYSQKKKCFVTADQPVFEPQLLPGQSFYAELSCHTIKDSYCWIVDVVSQIVFNKTIDVDFEVTVGTSKTVLHEALISENNIANSNKLGLFVPSLILSVDNMETLDLWNVPVPDTSKPIHLVIITHGLHSNIGADMLYLKEQIDRFSKGNTVVRGYFGNIGKTERGIKYLGSRVAEYIVELVTNNELFNNNKVDRISFIGHSLGGLVQTFAIAYLQHNFSWFFQTIRPVNFITIATPLLGVVHENPIYVKLALLAGFVGRSGRELGLKYTENNSKPLLLLLPSGPTHKALKRFERRTVYGNVSNDGIVPLRTSALLYLDYKGLSKLIHSIKKGNADKDNMTSKIPDSSTIDANNNDSDNKDASILPLTVQAMMSYFMPQKQRRNSGSKYHRYQTNVEDDEVDDGTSTAENGSGKEGAMYGRLPKLSFVESATTMILPPLPSSKYISDPDARKDVVIHDKVYHESDLPPMSEKYKNRKFSWDQDHQDSHDQILKVPSKRSSSGGSLSSIRQKIMNTIDYTYDVEFLEEEIAREYHKNMSWRKVLVKLKPDAHNNIIVRRRFANAYGWQVIDHLVENHFGDSEDEPEANLKNKSAGITNSNDNDITRLDSLDTEVDLSSILCRDMLAQQNELIDEEKEDQDDIERCEHSWINSDDDADALFAVGPGGLLSDVSEMVGNLRDQWYNYSLKSKTSSNQDTKADSEEEIPPKEIPPRKQDEDVDQLDSQDNDLGLNPLVGDFI